MFEDVQKLLATIRTVSYRLKRLAIFGADYFHALALVDSYNYMMHLADKRMDEHPEVQRVPTLKYALMDHFFNNADRHINLAKDSILNTDILGTPYTLRQWQAAGYNLTKRTEGNYLRRLQYWRSIYDQAPVTRTSRAPAGEDLFAPVTHIQVLDSKARRPRRNGHLVTYEEVILARRANFNASDELVPWWLPLNYGTAFAGRDGYPSSPGLHFVEDAEKLIPGKLTEYASYFDQFLLDMFNDDHTDVSEQSAIQIWAGSNLKFADEYVPTEEVARAVVFGSVF